MDFEDDLFNTAGEKRQLAEELELKQLLAEQKEEPQQVEVKSVEYKKSELLVQVIYNLVYLILNDPPLYAWHDPNYYPEKQSFTIQLIDGKVYINKIANMFRGTYIFTVKDFIKRDENGILQPDIEAIRNIKLLYETWEFV